MNIFILDTDPEKAARQQCDKHIVKMVLESGQMLSTAHRLLDGKLIGKHWVLADERENVLYKAVHMKHPCTLWTMESLGNYNWHFTHFKTLADEFTYRFEKQHKTWVDLNKILINPPQNIPPICRVTAFKLAMGAEPDCINPLDPVGSYRSFYITKQKRFTMKWSKREIPDWFILSESAI